MPLVQAKCTNCGASLEVDSTKDAAICPFCGTPYIVEKAINNYNTVNQISGNIVNVYASTATDFVIRAGTLEKYNGAETKVIIPDNVTIIGDSVFSECAGLTSVVIPDSVVSIGKSAFCDTSLVSITIPGTIKTVGSSAFANCKNLTSVTILDGVSNIGNYAFYNCTNLSSISLPDSIISIGDEAFGRCKLLNNITISDDTLKRLSPDFVLLKFQFSSQYGNWHWKAFESTESYSDGYGDVSEGWTIEHSSEWYLELKGKRDEEVKRLNSQLWIEQGKCRYCGGTFSGLFSRSCQRCHKKKDY